MSRRSVADRAWKILALNLRLVAVCFGMAYK
jgi:hypothetical protein